MRVYLFIFLMSAVMTQGAGGSVKKFVIFCSNEELCFYHILKGTSVIIIILLTYEDNTNYVPLNEVFVVVQVAHYAAPGIASSRCLDQARGRRACFGVCGSGNSILSEKR